jgi:hypothetical protein
MIAKHPLTPWRWFFFLTALEAGTALAALIMIPREGTVFSTSRVTALAFLAACLLVALYLCLRPPALVNKPVRDCLVLGAAIASMAAATVLFLLRYLDPVALLPYYQRLSVLLWFLLAFMVQALALLLIGRFGLHVGAVDATKALRWPAVITFLILGSTLILIAKTRLGLTPDSAYWGEPGVPILGWQLGLTIIGGLGALLLSLRVGRSGRVDTVLAIAVWLLALVIWLGVPIQVMQNSFYAPIRPPTGQAFPNSDAGYYDSMAQSLLIGYRYQGEIPSRPLYILMLAILHKAVGERYDLIIAGQTFVLALIPVVLFLLGRGLHSRWAGVIAALAAISREWTTLLVSSQTRVSNSKTLLVDLPTLLLLLVCCLVTVGWFKRKDDRSAILAGGVFGLLLLLRTQAIALLPAIVLVSALALDVRRGRAYYQIAAFLGGLALTLLPWLIHNYTTSGQLAIDAPFQYRIIASQYQSSGNLDIENVQLEGKSLLGVLAAFTIRNPGVVLGFVANHALATQVGSLLALPLIHTYNGLLADINLYWLRWDGTLSVPNILLVITYLAIISLGVGSAWSRVRWVGIVPWVFSFGYSLANGIARFSGWRYDLPADWIAYFYFSIGVAEILAFMATLLGGRNDLLVTTQEDGMAYRKGRGRYSSRIALLALIGMSPWFGEYLASPRYSGVSSRALIDQLSSASSMKSLGICSEELQDLAESRGAVIDIGRVLYPRFFTRGNGLASAHPWPAYAPRDYPRMGFLLLNESRQDVVLPMRESPQQFEHSVDAIMLGCEADGYLDARIVLFVDSGDAFLSTEGVAPCP